MKRGQTEIKKEGIIYEADIAKAAELLKQGFDVRHPRVKEQLAAMEKRNEPPMPDHGGFVYIFAAGDLIKVGFSAFDVDARWACIRSSNPLLEPPLYVTKALGEQRARLVERNVHDQLHQYHESGEWFRAPRQLVIDAVIRTAAEAAP